MAGTARSQSLTAAERRESARHAAKARWARAGKIQTAEQAPLAVRRLLKGSGLAALRWSNRDDRYAVAKEIVLRGDEAARTWLASMLSARQVRALVISYRGAGCNEADRKKLRHDLALSAADISVRPSVGSKVGG